MTQGIMQPFACMIENLPIRQFPVACQPDAPGTDAAQREGDRLRIFLAVMHDAAPVTYRISGAVLPWTER